MRKRLTIRLPNELGAWIEARSRKTGIPEAPIARELLEKARNQAGGGELLHLAGQIDGPRDLSSRKGFLRV